MKRLVLNVGVWFILNCTVVTQLSYSMFVQANCFFLCVSKEMLGLAKPTTPGQGRPPAPNDASVPCR